MMYNYPFFSFPHFNRYPYYTNYVNSVKDSNRLPSYYKTYDKSLKNKNGRNIKESARQQSNRKEENDQLKTKSGFSFIDHFLHQEDRKQDEKYFEILGIKLYNDDILLLCLIFFLYKEDVKDPYLFIALILLLLS